MSARLIVYGSKYCGMVKTVRRVLDQAEVQYDYVDIHSDPQGNAVVREINQGFESVPTLVFPDGSTLTEPTMDELVAKLTDRGIPAERLRIVDYVKLALVSPVFWVVSFILILAGLASRENVLLVIGLIFLISSVLISGQMD